MYVHNELSTVYTTSSGAADDAAGVEVHRCSVDAVDEVQCMPGH